MQSICKLEINRNYICQRLISKWNTVFIFAYLEIFEAFKTEFSFFISFFFFFWKLCTFFLGLLGRNFSKWNKISSNIPTKINMPFSNWRKNRNIFFNAFTTHGFFSMDLFQTLSVRVRLPSGQIGCKIALFSLLFSQISKKSSYVWNLFTLFIYAKY